MLSRTVSFCDAPEAEGRKLSWGASYTRGILWHKVKKLVALHTPIVESIICVGKAWHFSIAETEKEKSERANAAGESP